MYRIDSPSIIQLQFDSIILLMETRKLKMAGVDEPAKKRGERKWYSSRDSKDDLHNFNDPELFFPILRNDNELLLLQQL